MRSQQGRKYFFYLDYKRDTKNTGRHIYCRIFSHADFCNFPCQINNTRKIILYVVALTDNNICADKTYIHMIFIPINGSTEKYAIKIIIINLAQIRYIITYIGYLCKYFD